MNNDHYGYPSLPFNSPPSPSHFYRYSSIHLLDYFSPFPSLNLLRVSLLSFAIISIPPAFLFLISSLSRVFFSSCVSTINVYLSKIIILCNLHAISLNIMSYYKIVMTLFLVYSQIYSLLCYPMGCLLSRPDIETPTRRFKIKKLIATGGFSEVHLVEDMDSKEKYAMKKIKLVEEREMDKVKLEIDMHLKFGSHVNVVPLICDARPEELEFCLFFPFYSKGSVAALQEKNRLTNTYIAQSEVLTWMEGVSSALSLIHSHSVAHRDIKPHNILLTLDRKPVLTDFGSSVLMPIHIGDARESQLRRDEAAEMSSMPYRAPELFTCEIDSDLTVSVDIWSLACLFYSFCYFISPFDSVYEKGNSIALAVQSPQMIQYPSEAPYDDAVIDLIKGMLSVEVDTRPTINDVIEQINALVNRS